MDFRDYLTLFEASFTEKDIPDFFYVGCYFSPDFLEKKSYTPPGAACTLVGIEGVTSNSGTAFSFSSSGGAVLKMPGRELVELNKISRVMYDNPEYLASRGFRTPRRTQTGTGSPSGVNAKTPQDNLYHGVISHLIEKIRDKFQDLATSYSGILILQDGSHLNIAGLIDRLKKIPPRKTPPGTRVSQGAKKNRKPLEAGKRENNLKNIESATDLAYRVMAVLKGQGGPGIKDPKRLEPFIVQMTKDAAESTGWHKGEKEWVMKRQLIPNMQVTKCPFCKSWTQVPNDKNIQWDSCDNCKYVWQHKDDVEKCPECDSDKITHFLPGQYPCKRCNRIIDLTNVEKKQGARPMLHVPLGSVLYVSKREVPAFTKPYVIRLEKKLGHKIPNEEQTQALANEYQLYKRLVVHVVNNLDTEGKALAEGSKKKRSFDPHRVELQNEIKNAIEKGINKYGLLKKLLEKKGYPSAQINDALKRWEELGVIDVQHNARDYVGSDIERKIVEIITNNEKFRTAKQVAQELRKSAGWEFVTTDIQSVSEILQKLIEKRVIYKSNLSGHYRIFDNEARIGDNSTIKIVDANFDEDEILVYNHIKSTTTDGVSKSDIETSTDVKGLELDNILKKLIDDNKIQRFSNGNYDIKLSKEEEEYISPLEQQILDVIKDNNLTGFHGVNQKLINKPTDINEVKKALRYLTLKKKIFKGAMSDIYQLIIPHDTPLNELEQRVLDHLKEWPTSDEESFKLDMPDVEWESILKSIESLMARGLVTADNDLIKLNTDKIQATGTKTWSKATQKIVDATREHFFAYYREVATFLETDSYELNHKLEKLINSGVLVRESGRYMPKEVALPVEDTIEGKKVIEILANDYKTQQEIHQQLDEEYEYEYNSSTVGKLVTALTEKGLITTTYDPTKDTDVYHDVKNEYKIDYEKYFKVIKDLVEKAKLPPTTEEVSDEYDEAEKGDDLELSREGVEHMLEKMKENNILDSKQDFMDEERWFIKGAEGPKPIEYYVQYFVKKLKDDGTKDAGDFRHLIYQETGLGYDAISAVLEKAGVYENPDNPDKLIYQTHNDIIGTNFYHLKGQPLYDKDKYLKAMLEIIQKSPVTLDELRTKLHDDYKLSVSLGGVLSLSEELKGKIEKSKQINDYDVYHMPGVDIYEKWYKMVTDFIDGKGGKTTANIVAKFLRKQGGEYESIQNLFEKMAKDKLIHKIVIGDEEEDYWHNVLLATNPDAEMPTLEDSVLKFLDTKPDKQASSQSLIDQFRDEVDSTDFRKLLEKMITDEKLHYIKKAHYFYDSNTIIKLGKDTGPSAEEFIMQNLAQAPNNRMKMNQLWGLIMHKVPSQIALRNLIDKMVAEEKIHYYAVNESDYWYTATIASGKANYDEVYNKVAAFLKTKPDEKATLYDIWHTPFGSNDADALKMALEVLLKQGKLFIVAGADGSWWYQTVATKQDVQTPATPPPNPVGWNTPGGS